MASASQWKEALQSGACDEALCRLYLIQDPLSQRERLLRLVEQFCRQYGDREKVRIFSAPGRTELGGNHTDHQHGRVLAAAVTLDKLAIVAPQEAGPVEIGSASHPLPPMDWRDLSHYPAERGHSPSMIRGIFAGLQQEGYAAGGFAAVTDSAVPTGSGLSSSAAFELLLGQIQNALYNEGAIPPVALARIGQYAENEYFGKPCGLMDQTASAVGSAVSIDFLCPETPIVERIPCDFARWGMTLYVVNTGGSHADLTEDYAAIPREMKAVAEQFGCRVLREVDPVEFYARLPDLRRKVSDRAILRAMHFFEENERVPRMAAANGRGISPGNAKERGVFLPKIAEYLPGKPERAGPGAGAGPVRAGTDGLRRLAGTRRRLCRDGAGAGAERAGRKLSADDAGSLWRKMLYCIVDPPDGGVRADIPGIKRKMRALQRRGAADSRRTAARPGKGAPLPGDIIKPCKR